MLSMWTDQCTCDLPGLMLTHMMPLLLLLWLLLVLLLQALSRYSIHDKSFNTCSSNRNEI